MKTKIKILNGVMMLIIITGLLVSCKEDVNLTGIVLDKTTANVMVGSYEEISVIYTPIDASNRGINWESSNTDVALIDNGVVTGVSIGKATITATSSENPALQAFCELTVIPSTGQQVNVSGDITTDTRWYSNASYFLSGFVYVKENATLTIEPGTIIKGVSGTKAALIIERGSKIMAQGTAAKPIIFTSDKPAGQRSYGDWGGVVICGLATTNKRDDGPGVGIAEGGIGSRYGGNNDSDNSGILQYVRIEFPGIALTSTSNSEINGLTLYSVGSGTTIDHIQVSYSGDDSYEWFGGTVNIKHLVAFRGFDDDFDTDNGYRGKVQFALSIRDHLQADGSGANGFESDNDADGSQTTPVTAPVFSNVTLFGPYNLSSTDVNINYKRGMHIRRSSQLSIYNSVFSGWPRGLIIDGMTGNSPTMAENNTIQIENTIFAGMGGNYEAASGTPAIPYTIAQIQAYFESPVRANEVNLAIADIIGTSPFNISEPSILPPTGSGVLTGGAFTNPRLSGFFEPVTYRGAFGSTNWTEGWCNFNPQATEY